MKSILSISICLLLLCCNTSNSVNGIYKTITNNSIVKAIEFEDDLASFRGGVLSLSPASEYEVKNNKIYVNYSEGILVFKIIDANTIKCETSFLTGVVLKK